MLNPINVYLSAILLALVFNTFCVKTKRFYDVTYVEDYAVKQTVVSVKGGSKINNAELWAFLSEGEDVEVAILAAKERTPTYSWRWSREDSE